MFNSIELLKQIDPKAAEWLEDTYPGMGDTALEDLFEWRTSPQGQEYWSSIDKLLLHIEASAEYIKDIRFKVERESEDHYTVGKLIKYLETLPDHAIVEIRNTDGDRKTFDLRMQTWSNVLKLNYSMTSQTLRIGDTQ